jgi:hypothetical protein
MLRQQARAAEMRELLGQIYNEQRQDPRTSTR